MNRIILALAVFPLLAAAGLPVYRIDAFAGTDYNGDGGLASRAVLVQAQSVALGPFGDLYISDSADHRVRRVTRGGVITTVAGTGKAGYTGDGQDATKARLNSPYGVAVDLAGNLYVADLGNAVVRRVSVDGVITTVAGGGDTMLPANGARAATEVKLLQPRDLAVDPYGTVFISDFGGHRIYGLTREGLLVSYIGTGASGSAAEGGLAFGAPLSYPAGIAVDRQGNMVIADSGNKRVRRVVNGRMITLSDREGKPVEFSTPTAVAVDAGARVHVCDGGAQTTVVTSAGELSTLPVSGTGIAIGAEVFVSSGRHVRKLTPIGAEVVAGVLGGAGAGDGRPREEWRFNSPSAIVRDFAGHIYIADTANGRVRRISPSGELSTLTSQIEAPVSLAFDSKGRLHIGDRATGGVYRYVTYNRADLIARGADNRIWYPIALAFDGQDRLYVADRAQHVIRRVLDDGSATVVAGGGRETADGPALLAKLSGPAGLAFDASGDLWFSEAETGRIRKLTAGGRIVTLPGTELREPRAVRKDASGNLYVSDVGAHRIVRIAVDGTWAPVAGSGDKGLTGDGEAALGASLNGPADVAFEPDGSVLLADAGNNRIRKLTQTGTVEVELPPVAPPPPAAITMATVKVLHAATLQEQAVAPGQVAFVDSAEVTFTATTQVTLDGAHAEVLRWSAGRLTILIPAGLRTGLLELVVLEAGKPIAITAVETAQAAPGILTASGGSGQALALNADGTVNSWGQPAARGAVVTLYVTGEGSATNPVQADIAGYACEVVWSGAAPDLRGLMQVNVRTPSGFAPAGSQPVVLTINGVRTQSGVTVVTR